MVDVVMVLAPVIFIVLIASLVFSYIMSKQKERMTLIEKGIDISPLDSKKYRHHTNMRIGILLIALAIGLLVGNLVASLTDIEPFVAYAASLLLCEGLGFLVYYQIHKHLY